MSLVNCELILIINLDVNWSKNCVVLVTAVASPGATFSIIDTKLSKLYVLVVTLSQDNAKLLEN